MSADLDSVRPETPVAVGHSDGWLDGTALALFRWTDEVFSERVGEGPAANRGETTMKSSGASGLQAALAEMECRDVQPHECASRADADSVAWARRFGLAEGSRALKKVAGIHRGSCAAHTYPQADEPLITFGARLITWLFLFDDAYGEGPRAEDARDLMGTLGSYSQVLRHGVEPADATEFHRSLIDLRSTALDLSGSQDWLLRFAGSFDCYFGGCVMEYYARRSPVETSLKDYRRLRAWSIGTYPVFDLIELSPLSLISKEMSRPELAALRERAAMLCAWANDIYSFKKESADGDAMNLVSVLSRSYKLDLDEAFGAAAEVFNTDLALFREEREQLVALSSPDLERYADGLEDWIFGNLTWTALCRRYRDAVQEAS